jgi:hypothetical protein
MTPISDVEARVAGILANAGSAGVPVVIGAIRATVRNGGAAMLLRLSVVTMVLGLMLSNLSLAADPGARTCFHSEMGESA